MAESYVGETDVSDRSKNLFFQLYRAHIDEVQQYMKDHGLSDPVRECDVNLVAAILFCPYYSLWDSYRVYSYDADNVYNGLIMETNMPGEDNDILGRTEYQCPVYFFLSEDDLTCDPDMAQMYLESINAPDKGIGYTAGGHGNAMYHSDELVAFIHEKVLEK